MDVDWEVVGPLMGLGVLVLAVLVLWILVLIDRLRPHLRDARTARRLEDLRGSALDATQLAIVRQNLWLYELLPDALQAELQARTQVLLETLEFEGAEGLEVDEEMRVTIAAQASLLLLGRRAPTFPGVRKVIVHPDLIVDDDGEPWSGTANIDGTVSVSWSDTPERQREEHDGYCIVLHEFAHQLDFADERTVDLDDTPGAPQLSSAPGRDHISHDRWQRVMEREWERLKTEAEAERVTVLRPYGAMDLREFFAVATEAFFERAQPLRSEHPELYAVLRDYYGLDPATWAAPQNTDALPQE